MSGDLLTIIVAIPVKEPRDPKWGHGVHILRGPLDKEERNYTVHAAVNDHDLNEIIAAYATNAGCLARTNGKAIRLTQSWLMRALMTYPDYAELFANLYDMTRNGFVIYYQATY